MKKIKEKPVTITIRGKGDYFRIKVPLWKAYFIMGQIELDKTLVSVAIPKR